MPISRQHIITILQPLTPSHPSSSASIDHLVHVVVVPRAVDDVVEVPELVDQHAVQVAPHKRVAPHVAAWRGRGEHGRGVEEDPLPDEARRGAGLVEQSDIPGVELEDGANLLQGRHQLRAEEKLAKIVKVPTK